MDGVVDGRAVAYVDIEKFKGEVGIGNYRVEDGAVLIVSLTGIGDEHEGNRHVPVSAVEIHAAIVDVDPCRGDEGIILNISIAIAVEIVRGGAFTADGRDECGEVCPELDLGCLLHHGENGIRHGIGAYKLRPAVALVLQSHLLYPIRVPIVEGCHVQGQICALADACAVARYVRQRLIADHEDFGPAVRTFQRHAAHAGTGGAHKAPVDVD